MSAIRAVLLLQSCCVLAVLTFLTVFIATPCAGQENDCICNVTNSHCDESGVCRCDPGWDGERCEHCVPMPGCRHGSCQQPWQCSCELGWGGRFCDKDLYVCLEQQPCQNQATCVIADSGDYTCLCPEGFHGRHCELKAGPCHQHRSPCKNGGLCEDADGFAAELTCHCLAGFTGPHCENDMDDCLMTPCGNGATCLDGVNRFSCLCPAGFTGRFCTINLDDCASRPCLNGGLCLDLTGDFHCVCLPGFTGDTCMMQTRSHDAHEPGWTMVGWEGGGGHHITTTGQNHRTSNNSSHHDEQLLRVTVSEHSAAGLSEVQLTVLLVLAVLTLAVVALTAALVLQGHCRNCGQHTTCRMLTSLSSGQKGQQRTQQDKQDCQINFLNTTETEKKKLNMEVV